jgi:hypothetical protein
LPQSTLLQASAPQVTTQWQPAGQLTPPLPPPLRSIVHTVVGMSQLVHAAGHWSMVSTQ